jgi:hypothetical protein
MQTVIKSLPVNPNGPRWVCGCAWGGFSVGPHYCPTHNSPPVIEIRDETSGIENLRGATERPRPCSLLLFIYTSVIFSLGAITGAAFMWLHFKRII